MFQDILTLTFNGLQLYEDRCRSCNPSGRFIMHANSRGSASASAQLPVHSADAHPILAGYLLRQQKLQPQLDVQVERVRRLLRRKSFIIHGLWPNSPDPGFIPMISTSSYDPLCYSNYTFDLSWHDQSTIQRLNQVWPDLIQNNFWSYEWKKHGTCYLKLLNDRVNRGMRVTPNFARSVQQKYFGDALTLYQRITSNFRLTKGRYNNSDEFIRDLGLQPNQVNLFVVRNSIN